MKFMNYALNYLNIFIAKLPFGMSSGSPETSFVVILLAMFHKDLHIWPEDFSIALFASFRFTKQLKPSTFDPYSFVFCIYRHHNYSCRIRA